MDTAICKVVLPDGSIRVSDGICERHLRLDAIEKFGYLKVDVTRFEVRGGADGNRACCDSEGVPLAQPRYAHFYVVATAEELAGGEVSWMGQPVTRAVGGEVVVLTKLALAQEIYGAPESDMGLYQDIASLYRRILESSPDLIPPDPADSLDAAAREMGISRRLLERAMAYEIAQSDGAAETEEDDVWGDGFEEQPWGE